MEREYPPCDDDWVKGLPVKSVSSHSSENEIILAPNQKIMVTRVEKGGKNSSSGTIVYAVILPTDPNQVSHL